MLDYDLCVLGAGPAGFAAAMRASDLGCSVALIERSGVGGTGLHHGVLASKTLWELSRDYRLASRRDRGYRIDHLSLEYEAVVGVVQTALREKEEQIERQLAARGPNHGRETSDEGTPEIGTIRLIRGQACFEGSNTVRVIYEGSSESITAENFILATGSRPRPLDEIPVDGERIMTSDHFLRLETFPESMVIVGAGVVGCEFATILANFGRTRVFLIDRAARILPFEDEDIARVCTKNFEAHGVTIHHGAKLASMTVVDGRVRYVIEHDRGDVETFEVERALISIGRVPNTSDLGLDRCGVQLDDRGYVQSDDTRTTASHIYAVGDLTHDVALANVAEREGIHAAERICGVQRGMLGYDNLSTIMFLDPEVAAVGLNEQQAQQARVPYRVAVYDYSIVPRAIAMRATDGFVKLLVSDDQDARILGMRALGVHASTMIEAVSLMIRQRLPSSVLADLIHPHPAITEAVQDCLRMVLGRSLYKPEVFREHLRLSRVGYDSDGKVISGA